MRTCAFLTTDDLEGYVQDDDLLHPPLGNLGWRVDSVPWRRSGVDWGRYDLVVIRSTWDYQHDPDAFLDVLGRIEASGSLLANDLWLVRWNHRKTYLRELESRGVPIVPTVWGHDLDDATLGTLHRDLGGGIVVKPVIGASAGDTFRLPGDPDPAQSARACAALRGRDFMAQPFMDAIVDEGEFSLFYFAGELSHGVLKTPARGDFRVQEEHGGRLRAVTPEPRLRQRAEAVLGALPSPPVYARVDLVRSAGSGGGDDDFLLMEVELIEPSLYLRLDDGAPGRFARALDLAFRTGRPGSAPHDESSSGGTP